MKKIMIFFIFSSISNTYGMGSWHVWSGNLERKDSIKRYTEWQERIERENKLVREKGLKKREREEAMHQFRLGFLDQASPVSNLPCDVINIIYASLKNLYGDSAHAKGD